MGLKHFLPDPNDHLDDIVEYAAYAFGKNGLQAKNYPGSSLGH